MDAAKTITGTGIAAVGGGFAGYGTIRLLPGMRQLRNLRSVTAGLHIAEEIDRSNPAIQRALANATAVTEALGSDPGVRDIIRAVRIADGTAYSGASEAMQRVSKLAPELRTALTSDRTAYDLARSTLPRFGALAIGGALLATVGASLALSALFDD